jgi:CotS family spore coat protein
LETDEFNLYETIFRLGIKPKVLELLPAKSKRVVPYYNDGYLLETDIGNVVLWTHRSPEAYLACQLQILQLCEQNGSVGFLYPMQLKDGRYYAEFNENSWFYITLWPDFEKVRFGNSSDLKAIVDLLVSFRKVIHDNGFLFYLTEKKSGFNLQEKYGEIKKQLDSFEMLAMHRLRPTAFDRQYLSYLPEARQQIVDALKILDNSNYQEALDGLSSPDIIINKLTRHNLGLDREQRAFCFQLDDFRWDLPIIDLAIFLIKTGRSSKWSSDWYQLILKEYEIHFPLNKLDHQIIHSYVTFPWSFYRLASRYYYNRVDWALWNFTEKMTRIMEDEPNRRRFLANL